MNTRSFLDPRDHLRWSFSALLALYAGSAGAAPSAASVEDALADPDFIRGCVGDVDGEVFVYVEETYVDQASALQLSFAAGLHRWSTTARIRFRAFDEGEHEASCAAIPTPSATPGDDPRLTMYLTLSKGADDRFSAVDVVIQRRDGCRQVTLRCGAWIDDCGAVRRRRRSPSTAVVTASPALAARPRPPALPQTGGRDGSGLLIAGGVFGALGTVAHILRPTVGEVEGMDRGGALAVFFAGPSFNLLALGLLTGGASLRGSRDGRHHHASESAGRAGGFITGGGIMLAAGVSSWAAGIAQFVQSERSSDTTCTAICAFSLSAIGQMSTVAGAGLLGYGVAFRENLQRADRRRFAMAPQLGSRQLGLAITGQF